MYAFSMITHIWQITRARPLGSLSNFLICFQRNSVLAVSHWEETRGGGDGQCSEEPGDSEGLPWWAQSADPPPPPLSAQGAEGWQSSPQPPLQAAQTCSLADPPQGPCWESSGWYLMEGRKGGITEGGGQEIKSRGQKLSERNSTNQLVRWGWT